MNVYRVRSAFDPAGVIILRRENAEDYWRHISAQRPELEYRIEVVTVYEFNNDTQSLDAIAKRG